MPFKKNQKQAAPTLGKKATIPTAFREQIWLREFGKVYEAKCPISWCHNTITVYDFESGHNVPESKGGSTTPDNLIPICSRCNKSMGNRYTITEWSALGSVPSATTAQGPTVGQGPHIGHIPSKQTEPRNPWWICCA